MYAFLQMLYKKENINNTFIDTSGFYIFLMSRENAWNTRHTLSCLHQC